MLWRHGAFYWLVNEPWLLSTAVMGVSTEGNTIKFRGKIKKKKKQHFFFLFSAFRLKSVPHF